MLRDWRLKAAVQKVLSAVPSGHRLNYALQRRTGGLPISDTSLQVGVERGVQHLEALSGQLGVPIPEARFFEFGAGWDLHMPLVFRALGVQDQVVVDIRPLLRPELVADMARRLHEVADPPPGWDPVPPPGGTTPDLDPWLDTIGIEYRAPADARATGLPSGSVHAVTSTSTLEHIPPDDIVRIGRELVRLLAPGGGASFLIDYSDHYSHFDTGISPWNFLGISERRWRWVNSDLHFQNRLRHPTYVSLLHEAGFRTVDAQLVLADDADDAAATIEALPPVAPFAGVDVADLAVLGAHFVVVPAAELIR